MKHALVAATLAAGLVTLGGCAIKQPAQGSMGAAGPSGIETTGFSVNDPVMLSNIRERALSTIQELATSETPQFRANAVEAATASPERLRSVIEQGLKDENPGVRAVAAMAVGKVRLTRLTDQVRPLLMDQNTYVKSAAIFALARCDVEVDRSPLANMLMKDPSAQVRSQVAYILGELGDKSAVLLLRAALRQPMSTVPQQQVRLFELQVAEAMIKLGAQRQRPVVRAALFPSQQEELELTALACQILGEVQDKESIHQLISLSNYKDEAGKKYPPEVQLAIAGSLAQLGHREGSFVPDQFVTHKSALVRSQAAYVYGQIGKVENWGKLDALMGDSYGGVRVAAAAAVLKSANGAGLQY